MADALSQQTQHHAASAGYGGSSVAGAGCVWSLNVGSAVTLVFANKALMSIQGGHGFSFAVTLSGIHSLAAAGCVMAAQAAGLAEKTKSVPWKATLWFSLVGVVSIGSLNLSLLVNSVGLYQVAKLLVIPFVCGVEAVWMGRRFNNAIMLAIATVMVGVGVVTINDIRSGATQLLGVLLAAVSVVASGSHQVLCGSLQRTYELQSHQLLAASAAVQGAMLLLLGPWVDAWVSGRWLGSYTLTVPAVGVLLLSCLFSMGVNVSHFMCLGRFSAATFQVLGHTKTVLVLLISWLAHEEAMSARKAAGMAVAVAGMQTAGCHGYIP
ncbi:hypothetical protein OEZ85_002261 [Tetradesmus obliquus]|uniref:Sugar phosphate transporter domain-containing protein n=1 Tax=Tetradesmus obliquus TaxID=3088 RepID=A0ABY8U3D1_TETOB|nr:hypothetical protein OEZ85_002261 [Tetradesmus obliquus]